MADHIRADHYAAIAYKLKLARQRKLQIALKQWHMQMRQSQPVKVSVIKVNSFYTCKKELSVK